MSLLPEFAAAQLPGELAAIEQVVSAFERERQQGATVEQAAQQLRPDIEAQGALRWLRRRRRWVRTALALLVGISPGLLAEGELTLVAARNALAVPWVLVQVRDLAAAQLAYAPAPTGFAPLLRRATSHQPPLQQAMGPDPPG